MSRYVKIVLPCHDEGEWLRATVDSILERTRFPSFEVFVLANGDTRTDFTFAEDPAYRARLKLKRVEEALGVGKCINAAVAPGDADYYVFLDAHCLVAGDDWLERVVDCLESHPGVSMVQPEVIQFTWEGDLSPGERPDPARCRDEHAAYSIIWSWPYDDFADIARVQMRPSSAEPYEAMAGGGMAVFAKAETFHRLGGYDPEVDGWYPETMDYCVRAWLLGHPMLVDPTVRIRHRVKTSAPDRRDFRDAVHGFLRTAYKYLSARRRDLAEVLFRRHGLGEQVDWAIERIRCGRWLEERLAHERARVHDDDWLFARFDVSEGRLGVLE
jgi:GT2 family glycosyltransferase